MKYTFTKRKTRRVAQLLLLIWIINIVEPIGAYALTSGPSQPEATSFQPAGVTDMVDLFSGDFKYNIPLMDIDGYPINLNYQSGVSMEEEASWVGLGWNLNVGSISRQLRGIPDDMAGDADMVTTEHSVKDKVTVGGKLTAKVEVRGKQSEKEAKKNGLAVSGSLTFGIFSDNYVGIGAEVGANAGISYSFSNSGAYTAGLGIGVLSNTASGVDVSPYISMSIKDKVDQDKENISGLTSSLGYNTRSGMKSLSFSPNLAGKNFASPAFSFNTEARMPRIQIPYVSTYQSLSFDGGYSPWVAVYVGWGATGYRNSRHVDGSVFNNPAYGFLYAEKGKNRPNAVMDFIREKDNPVIPETPNLALPIATPDIFVYNSHVGSGQFRLYRGGTGVLFDNEANDRSMVNTFGIDVGGSPANIHGGVTFFNQNGRNTTKKWTKQNKYLEKGDFQDAPTADPAKQHVFFRNTDEKNIEDEALTNKLLSKRTLAVDIVGKTANNAFKTQNALSSNITTPINERIAKNERQLQSTAVSYLTGAEASKGGLDRAIKTYDFNNFGSFALLPNHQLPAPITVQRDAGYRKPHHISEITVNESNGQRAVYGLPVYNMTQEEYSFALNAGYSSENGQVGIGSSIPRNQGIDHYYHREKQPAYAYSYMLTGLLSPDYVDKTGDGITSDDNGTAIKFNYSKIEKYKWRTPYRNKINGAEQNLASLNRGLLADPDDDKGSIVYGEKEIAYVHSIESRTKIAYFITEDREDALGVADLMGGVNATVRQKRLREIRLYSKADTLKPIKVIKFEYGYDLCAGTPNSNGGSFFSNKTKLTLRKVWFEYGNSTKGAQHAYSFAYNNYGDGYGDYASLSTDRWGVYKPKNENPAGLTNEEFPYASQNRTNADKAAGLWNLKTISLPSGGTIDVDYEADDYAYVQDKRATVMVAFEPNGSNVNNIGNSNGIKINLEEAPPTNADTKWFKDNYLNGSDYLYTKAFIQIDPNSTLNSDFVPAYCKVKNVTFSGNIANIEFEKVTEAGLQLNPIRFAALQRMKNEYPRYAYPGFENRIKDGNGSIKAVVSAISNAVKNLSELKENFYKRAIRKGFANYITPQKSFARIVKASGKKIGGGSRVKKISITDNWQDFTESNNSATATYGQEFEYTTVLDGKTISSGVATYEPSIGNDENALKKPIAYIQRVKGAINNYFELEEPFGESFFPSPSVGYSKVTVKDLDSEHQASTPKTGYAINEYYTAKDFPVRVVAQQIQTNKPPKSNVYGVLYTSVTEELTMSQGYTVELNDMHGKAKASRIYNQAGAEISNTIYTYKVEDPTTSTLTLNNKVDVIDAQGNLQKDKILGRDIELFTDFREQESINSGRSVTFGADIMTAFFFIPLPHLPFDNNDEYKLFRSACAVKLIQSRGVIDKVTKMENGSTISVQNVAFDGLTGDAIITKTQNEFKKDYYTVNLPAYWVYDQMGGAYKNLGMILNGVTLNSYQEINSNYWNLLHEGDELVNLGNGNHYWVTNNRANPYPELFGDYVGNPSKSLIDREGKKLESISPSQNTFKVVRSSFRNLMDASAGTLVSLNYPIMDGKLILTKNDNLAQYKVLNASVTTYDDVWPSDNCGQLTERIENTSRPFLFKDAYNHQDHGSLSPRIFDPCDIESGSTVSCGDPYRSFNNSYFKRKLWSEGIWINDNVPNSLKEPLGFVTTVYAPYDKQYWLGYSADDRIKVKVNGQEIDLDNSPLSWAIRPIDLNAGPNTIEVEGYNEELANPNGYNLETFNPGSFGIEIYNNTLNELLTANASTVDVIFNTSSLLAFANYNNLQTFRTVNGARQWRFTYNNYYNPFVQGAKGNWRPYEQNVYQETRAYNDLFNPTKKGVNVKDAGALSSFYSYWFNPLGQWLTAMTANKWVRANKVTLYDKYGQELENKDALGRYSAANFDFNGLLPAAVASNAMNREIYANSFEDVKYRQQNSVGCAQVGFSGNAYYDLVAPSASHTGNYSFDLNAASGIKLVTKMADITSQHKTKPYFAINNGEFNLINDVALYPAGFAPVPNKNYIMNVWVKDKAPLNKNINVVGTLKGNTGTAVSISFTCKAIIEGWKLLEAKLPLTSISGPELTIELKSGLSEGVKIDDIRIHPENSQMKSYVYSARTFKLMAELDENAFATFYEYDDEGNLVRVKKETERGIVTLKENRSSLRKANSL